MNGFENAMDMLPEKFRRAAEQLEPSEVEEFRLRAGYRPSVFFGGKEHILNCDTVRPADISRIIERVSSASFHSVAFSMQEGYINCRGLRVGICGRAVIQDGKLKGLRDFSSLNIRIPHQCTGICDSLLEELYGSGFKNSLFISPPGLGKTTALRELIRSLSERGMRIGVADDRNEISASWEGAAGFDLGPCTDCIISAPKSVGAMMLLRGMNENIIAMDEISSPEDIEAVLKICGCGVGILASAHAADSEELYRRPLYRQLMEAKIFTYLISIKFSGTGRTYRAERI